MESCHVVAADVLDDPAAATGGPAVRLDHLHADNEVTRASKLPLERADWPGSQRATDGGQVGAGGVHRKELAVLLQRTPQGPQRDSRLDRGSQVGWIVVYHTVQSREVEGKVVALRRVAQREASTASEGRHGESAPVRGLEDSTDLVDRFGSDGGRRLDSVDRVARVVPKPLSPKGLCHGLSGGIGGDGHLRRPGRLYVGARAGPGDRGGLEHVDARGP